EGTLRFEVVGTSLRLYFNGALVATATDSVLKSGSVGVSATQHVSFDDFSASAFDSTPSFGDSFARPDATALGSQWKEQAGDLIVKDGQLVAKGAAGSLATYPFASLKDASVQAQVTAYSPGGFFLTGIAGVVARHSGPGDRNYYLGALVGVN